LPTATAQSTYTKELRILSKAASLHTRLAGATFQLNKSDVEEDAGHDTWLSLILHDCTSVNSVTSGLSQRCFWCRVTGWRFPTSRSNALQLFSRVK